MLIEILNQIKNATFNDNFNENREPIYLSKQDVSRTIRGNEIILRGNL